MYYIIANEIHTKGKKSKNVENVKAVFERAGKKCKVLLASKLGDSKRYAEEISSKPDCNTIVVMGGDGTLHEVLNGIKNFDNCYLGLIPVGTGNDFALSANIPKDVKRAAEIIAFRAPRKIDFIELSSGLRSINAVGMGIDVDVLKRTYASNRKGKSKYVRSLISSLLHFKSHNFTIRYDGKEEKHYGLIAAVGNGSYIGGGIKVFPDADLSDGYLDLFMVDYISKLKILGAFLKLMRGKINKIKGAKAVKVKQAEFENDEENFTIQAEGELYENVPISARVAESKLFFYLPD